MLRELRIENLLLIERAELRFGEGLNVITGETGAGKTVLAHSLDLILGGKPRSGIVRPGAGEAWVEGALEVPDEVRADPRLAELFDRIPDGEEVVLARRVSADSGRSSAFVCGRSASASDLRVLGSRLLAFYGQHEHRKLTLASVQAEVLDRFAGSGHLELRDRYRVAYADLAELHRERDELLEREGARERDIDLLRFELDEIETARPILEAFAELRAERDRLRHAEGLREAAAGAALAIGGDGGQDDASALAGLAAAEGQLGRASGVDPGLDAIGERLGAALLELSDIAAELRGQLESLAADPQRLEEIETSLAEAERLVRKHGTRLTGDAGASEEAAAVLEHAERCVARLERLQGAEARREEIDSAIAAAEDRRAELATGLSASRVDAARSFESEIADRLAELAMDGARIEVGLEPHPDGFGAAGAETVELRVATNPGIAPAPLGDAASGGELSRVMLAIAGLAGAGDATTIVFDEIDAGVGGKVARKVGERLRALGGERQVICITHLAQVASLADAHFRVDKRADAEGAVTTVEAVAGEEKVAEIVRMLGSDADDEAATTHARDLLAA